MGTLFLASGVPFPAESKTNPNKALITVSYEDVTSLAVYTRLQFPAYPSGIVYITQTCMVRK
jgi:hypothetical protein